MSEARSRRRRAGVGIAIGTTDMTSTTIALAAVPRGQPVFHCHKVLLQYENARNIPIESRDVCEWRKD